MAHRNAACVWRSKKHTTQRTPSPPCNTVVGVLCCGDQFIWNVESSQGVRNCEKRRICEDLWRQWHNYKSLFYRSKSRFDFGHSSYCDTAQLSRLCDWSAHYWSLFQVTFSSFVPFWLHPSCLISTVQAGVDGVGNISLAHFGPLWFSTEHNWMLMLHFTPVFKHDHPSCSSIHLFTCLHFFNLPM